MHKILPNITTPHQLRRLREEDLVILADELRERIIEVVSNRGGHLASNLGMAELTIALHHVFDFSTDRLLWDVGHQCYAHKLLTGRAGKFDNLRQKGGLSGFPAPSESPYDLFATGHAGTAISTATGMAWGDLHDKADTKIVSVVGDASIVNGMSLEGINYLSGLNRQFLIILNDNSMAIDRTQGGMANALDRIRLTQTYKELKHSTENFLEHVPLGHEIAGALRNLRTGLKATIHGRQVFESLGLGYFGPVDGHDIPTLIRVLRRIGKVNRPVVLHVHTVKGCGCEYAVDDPCRFHSPSAYTMQDGKAVFPVKTHPSWTNAFADALVEMAEKDDRIVALTAAMPDGTGLVKFRDKFPDRYVDVGISESHAVAMAAGLSKTNHKPVVAIYSTFMQRAMDQIFHDLALQKLGALLCMDRAGLVGSDGAVHHGTMDIAMLRTIPGTVIMAPADSSELKAAMEFGIDLGTVAAIRYPRDEVPNDLQGDCPPFELGKARVVRDTHNTDGTFLCYGATVETAIVAAAKLEKDDGYRIGIINARFAKPLDVTLIAGLIRSGKPLITCEDHAVTGGFGSAVLEMAAERHLDASNVRMLGLPDRFIAQATREQQMEEVGMDVASFAATMKDMILHPAGHPTRNIL